MEVGADRVLYSVDYPYEDVGEATEWFDKAPISEPDRVKIAYGNARQLFRLNRQQSAKKSAAAYHGSKQS
jgi:2,3-dihydroxybenzoate decarboxylase